MWFCRQTEDLHPTAGELTLKNMDTRGLNPYHGDVNYHNWAGAKLEGAGDNKQLSFVGIRST